jgi:hypothetical protein
MSLGSAALNGSKGEVQMLVVAQVKNTGGATLPQMIVEEILKRKLTYYRDCIPAIQGLGTRIHKAASQTSESMLGGSMAGLREKNMLLYLLWKRPDGAKWGKYIQSDRASRDSYHWAKCLLTRSWTSSPVYVETPLKYCLKEKSRLLTFKALLPTVTKETECYKLHWLCQASEINDPGDGFIADKPNFDINKHRKLLWIKIASIVGDSVSGEPPTVRGVVIRCKGESQDIYKRVGYIWQEMPEVEVSGDTQLRDIMIV